MQPSTIRMGLLLGGGEPRPAPGNVVRALESVEVRQEGGEEGGFGQGFQLTFRAERGGELLEDYPLVRESSLAPGSRVIVTVTVAGKPSVLVDGIVTHHELTPGGSPGSGTRLTVTGKDLSVLMDMVELALGYPALGTTAIVNLILLKYAGFGIAPQVVPPPTSWSASPTERVPFQTGTDHSYLVQLASHHGYVFGVRPVGAPGLNVAYWGPLPSLSLPQRALTVDSGHATNVASLQFTNDALAPEQVYGLVHLEESKLPLPVAALVSTNPPLSPRPAILFNQPFVRKTRLGYRGGNPIEAQALAQSRTDLSTREVVTGTGSLDVLRYGTVLRAPGIVGVRGAGESYDGFYRVKKVTHRLEQGSYTQDFTITRGGTGSWTSRIPT